MNTRRPDIVDQLRFICEQAQCDCTICETAAAAATEIKTLRAIGDTMIGAIKMGMWETLDIIIKDWQDARNNKPHKEGP